MLLVFVQRVITGFDISNPKLELKRHYLLPIENEHGIMIRNMTILHRN